METVEEIFSRHDYQKIVGMSYTHRGRHIAIYSDKPLDSSCYLTEDGKCYMDKQPFFITRQYMKFNLSGLKRLLDDNDELSKFTILFVDGHITIRRKDYRYILSIYDDKDRSDNHAHYEVSERVVHGFCDQLDFALLATTKKPDAAPVESAESMA